MNYSNTNQKFLFLNIVNKFFLTKIKIYKLKHQLKFKLNFNVKIIAIHYLILKFFSLSKNIILSKPKPNTICILTKNYSKYTVKFLTKLNIETLLLTSNKLVVNKKFITLNFKNLIILSKLEKFYTFFNNISQFYLNIFINGTFNSKILVYIFKKLFLNI